MEDNRNNHPHHHQQQQQQYVITDLRQLMTAQSSTHFTSIPLPTQQPTAKLFPGHWNLTPHHHQHYEMMMFNRDIMPSCTIHNFAPNDSIAPKGITVTTTATMNASTPPFSGLEAETPCCVRGDAYTGRWPRQETLTLLEIRSRLHPKLKEANQKGPLWDEVSRKFFWTTYSIEPNM
ncbi:unnamed protein product [Lupinus luteus]|uniref:Uncharacterized protein n=1 Tax=Lupinus luteus TaxID=3873 RepID=A0AAV1X6T4_LUPLU